MKSKFIYLFLALLLPGCIFVFLKLFGRNEFAVAPLYQSAPPTVTGCSNVTLPYSVPDTVLSTLNFGRDKLVVVIFDETTVDGRAQIDRVTDEIKDDAVHIIHHTSLDVKTSSWKRCTFFLAEPRNTVLVDAQGKIRGEYTMSDREEVDRLLTEITIILKKY
ncbi:hypothetical protein [Pseudochryseolinea flava]|uniref:Thioredoxin domain-containing protein n=1 Tax=Pseudochryseolinea flava TaxID=2059302 RepID=A0A364XWJ6_9BACT|nr:hypothetical protein [Pseudochryseolinea flava]RAV98584.1 hypothetical protein DQQ10_22870 [Pseudochryseolinea flava]